MPRRKLRTRSFRGRSFCRRLRSATAVTEKALINQYCVVCHNQKMKKAGQPAGSGNHARQPGCRPRGTEPRSMGEGGPQGARRHDAAVRYAAAEARSLRSGHRVARKRTRQARSRDSFRLPGLHRLNRTEYANAIRDLLALEIDPGKYLPSDDSTRGFDNIAGALVAIAGAARRLHVRGRQDQPPRDRRCDSAPRRRPIACPKTPRRIITSKACRSAPAAA